MSTETITTESVIHIGSACARCKCRVDGPSAGPGYMVLCAMCRLIAKARRNLGV